MVMTTTQYIQVRYKISTKTINDEEFEQDHRIDGAAGDHFSHSVAIDGTK